MFHCFLFWGGDILRSYRNAREGRFDDRHHEHMAKTYKEAPWWWYIVVLVGSFVLGLIVVAKENITLPIWAYVVSLLIGMFIAPIVRSDTFDNRSFSKILIAYTEHPTLLPLRQWHRH